MPDKNDAILQCVTKIKADVEHLKEDMSRRLSSIEDTVFGNGNEGLKVTVAKLKSESGVAKHYLSMAIGAIIVAAVGTWFTSRAPADDHRHEADQATEVRRSN